MKTTLQIILLLVYAVLIYSCEKTLKDAGCDVNGVWLGHWQINGGSTGTFITPVIQNETDFDGEIYIRFDLPSLENHGVEFSGKLRNSEVRAMIEISGVEITASGDISDDSLVSGEFNVSLGYSGTYSGWKIPLQSVNLTEIYRLTNTSPSFSSIVYVNGNIWMPDLSGNLIYVINRQGNIIRNIQGNFINDVSTYDGEFIWTYGYDTEHGGEKIFKYDTLGNMLGEISPTSYFVDALALNGSELFMADNYNRQIYKLDESGVKTDSIPASFNSVSSFSFYNGKIIYSEGYSPYIYAMSYEGDITSAYQLLFDNVRCITSDGNGSFWSLSEEYILNENAPSNFTYVIHHFTLD